MRCLSAVKSIVELIGTSQEKKLVIHAVGTNVLEHIVQQLNSIPRQKLRGRELPLLRNLVRIKCVAKNGSMARQHFVAAQLRVGRPLPKPRELVLNFPRLAIGSIGKRRVEASHGCTQARQQTFQIPLRSVELVLKLRRQSDSRDAPQ